MAGFQNGQWFWPNFIQISPTVIPTSPAGSTGFTEFPERLTHSYYGGFQLLDLTITELKSHMTC